jgi:hypothetical protein
MAQTPPDVGAAVVYSLPREAASGAVMSRLKLPDGVPHDNAGKASFGAHGDELCGPSAGNPADYKAPDMATPQFDRPSQKLSPLSDRPVSNESALHSKARRVVHDEYEEVVEEDDDEENARHRHASHRSGNNGSFAILIAITALLAALGAIVIATNRSSTPLCSSQPEWNQYNCRAG